MAEMSNISRAAYRNIENGISSPKVSTLQDIVAAMGVKLEELVVPIKPLKSVRFRASKKLHRREQIFAQEDGGPAIVVNTWDRISVERRIFSAAHELGHLLLHLSVYRVEEESEVKAQENEANLFASHFLMPLSQTYTNLTLRRIWVRDCHVPHLISWRPAA
ncbi:protein of unknown function DUF955 [Kyrpidia tusciae DSM 2912]|uniref:HTH cro/C1-type domain-containing protein n=1 Tax=Kyrpidia tusciae (strain DSM 2912 / NBRC 15312 / T2) TaxID=562970 RepID=D5WX15_KYRT2|nr:protein of unknown function DUF955 [Kyrpidia tusciae DSM 2912]